MKVFKFGGNSVKNTEAVKNVADIVKNFDSDKLVVIVSAMGTTTSHLEKLIKHYLAKENWKAEVEKIKNKHINIGKALFSDGHEIFLRINEIIERIKNYLEVANFRNDLELYSEIISQGELLSTRIVQNYLNEFVRKTVWMDARKLIKTDFNFIDSRIDWEITQSIIQEKVKPLATDNIVVTQGFIGSNNEGKTTTLGKDGSDFSGAIFATCLNAESITIWKDVAGVFNADPKIFTDAEIIKNISYQEASELTYYGAKVIHPRTIKPLAQHNIKLYVRPFNDYQQKGTVIGTLQSDYSTYYITKKNQVLINFKVKDYSFIDEKKLSSIFHELDTQNIKINLMQNSAISFSICIDKKFDKVEKFLKKLESKFDITSHEGLELFTIKNFDKNSLKKIASINKIIMEQRTTKDIHLLYQPNLN